jgi:hypothetical protein
MADKNYFKSLPKLFKNFSWTPKTNQAQWESKNSDIMPFNIADPDIPQDQITVGPTDSQSVAENIRWRQTSWYRMYENIERWRQAIQFAENPVLPQRILLYRIYDEVWLDQHVRACIDLKVDRILSVNFNLLDNDPSHKILDASGNTSADSTYGEPMVEESRFFEQEWFAKLIQYWVEAKFWGYSLIQIDGLDDNHKLAIHKINPKWLVPERKEFKQNVYDITGIPYNDPYYTDFLIEIGKNTDLGLFLGMAVNVLDKRRAMQNWTQFQDTFGMPMIIYKYKGKKPEQVREIERFIKDMASRGYAIIDKDDELEIEANPKSDAYNVYKEQINALNTEIACMILGADYIDNKAGSHAQSKTKDRQADIKTVSDLRLLEYWINEEVIPKLRNLDVPIPEFAYFKFEKEQQISENEVFTNAMKLLAFADIPSDFFIDRFGIPIDNWKIPPDAGEQPKPLEEPVGKKPVNEKEKAENEQLKEE